MQPSPINSPPALTEGEWQDVIRVLHLTPQQTGIVRLILQDKKDKEIAAEMRLNFWTVRTHLSRIFTRLGVDDRVGLVLRVFAVARENANAAAPESLRNN